MQGANEESYQELITKLQSFFAEATECCSKMKSAGIDCVDNTNNDPAAVKANGRLNECVSSIVGALHQIKDVIHALQEELEAIREAAAKVDSM